MSALACGAYDAYSAWRAVCACLRLRGCVCVRVGSRPEMTLGVRGHYTGFTPIPPPPHPRLRSAKAASARRSGLGDVCA